MRFIPWYRGTEARQHLERAFDALANPQVGQSADFTDALVAGLRQLRIQDPAPADLAALAAAYDSLV